MRVVLRSLLNYSLYDNINIEGHITNINQQKQLPFFEKEKFNQAWDIITFENYLKKELNISSENIDFMYTKIKAYLTYLIDSLPGSVKMFSLDNVLYFQDYGVDI